MKFFKSISLACCVSASIVFAGGGSPSEYNRYENTKVLEQVKKVMPITIKKETVTKPAKEEPIKTFLDRNWLWVLLGVIGAGIMLFFTPKNK